MKNNKTQIYTDNNKTSVYGDTQKRTKPSVHNLNAGDNIVLNKKEYNIIEIVSEGTGEAVIYKIESVGDFTAAAKKSPLGDLGAKRKQKFYALKLYYEFHDTEQEPNTEALSRIKNIKDVDILRLYDFGTGINKYKEKYCFEISDFAFGHDLLTIKNLKEKYNPDFIEKELITQIFKGILRLHENKIYHCDLKPQNVFYLDKEQKEIVIGDYGSAKTFEFDAEKSSRKTTTVKGTDFYLPPEQARGFISKKNDYYSFGMILLHLLYPEEILQDENAPLSFDRSKLKQIIENQFEGKPIIDYNPKYERINKLIEALTLVDFNRRWGKEQLQQWIAGEDIELVYEKFTQTEAGKTDEQVLIFGGHKISTVYDVRDYILSDENWYADLIEDKDNREEFINHMSKLYNGGRTMHTNFNRIIKEYSQEGIDFVADAIIRFFIPEHPVIFGSKSFNFAQKSPSEPVPNLIREDLRVMKTTAEAFSFLILNLWEKSDDKDIRLYIFRYEFALRQLSGKQPEVVEILKILYKQLKLRKEIKNKFYYHNIYAYTAVSKSELNNIKQFLFAYLPTKIKIKFFKFLHPNKIHYSIEKTLTDYFIEIGIKEALSDKFEKRVLLKFPKDYSSFDNFCEKTSNAIINSILNKHRIKGKRLSENNFELFKTNFKNAYEKLYKKLENEYNKLRKEFPEEIKRHDTVKQNLKEIESIISQKKYHLINLAFNKIAEIRTYKKKQVSLKKQKTEKAKPAKEIRITIFYGITFSIASILLVLFVVFLERREEEQAKEINKYAKEENADTIKKNSSKNTVHSGMDLIFVKGGTFKMGTKIGIDAEPIHKVSLSDFYIGKYEITNEQFCNFLNEYGSDKIKEGKYEGNSLVSYAQINIQLRENMWMPKSGYENHAVNRISWFAANEYCEYYGGSLPTEAQWEFAGKGGIYSKGYEYSGSNDVKSVAWSEENSGDRVQEVGMKNPNEIGIYDMSGNLQEWTKDTYESDYYKKSPEFNPCNENESDQKSIRGSSFMFHIFNIEDRSSHYMTYSNSYFGFRFCYNDSLKTSKPDNIQEKETK